MIFGKIDNLKLTNSHINIPKEPKRFFINTVKNNYFLGYNRRKEFKRGQTSKMVDFAREKSLHERANMISSAIEEGENKKAIEQKIY